jgi:hypothetical protein
MCANTLLWAGAALTLFLLIYCVRPVPAQVCITHVNWDPLDLGPESPEHSSLQLLGKVISKHLFHRTVLYCYLARYDPVLDEKVSHVCVLGPLTT